MKNDWIKIKNYYIYHSISFEQLAKKFKVSIGTIKEHSRKENWLKFKEEKKTEIEQKVDQKTFELAVDKKIAANELHNELYTKGLEVAKILLDQYLNELQSDKPRRKTKATAYNLDFVMKAIANAQKGQRLSLNIEKLDTTTPEPEIRIVKGIDMEKI